MCDWLIATMSQTTTPHIFFVAAAFLQLLLPGDRQILILFPWRALRQLARGREKVSWFLLSAVQHTLLPIRPCRAPTHILNHSLFLFSSSFSQLPHPPLRAGCLLDFALLTPHHSFPPFRFRSDDFSSPIEKFISSVLPASSSPRSFSIRLFNSPNVDSWIVRSYFRQI